MPAGAAGNTEGKIMDPHDPRNDSGVRSLDEVSGPHKTPALVPPTDRFGRRGMVCSLEARSSARFDQVNV